MTTPAFTARLDAPNLLHIDMSGKLDALSMEIALSLLVPVVKDMHHGGALIRAEGVEWPTLGAIGVELRHWVQLMAMVRKVDRVAVLTEQGWVRNLAFVESLLIPNLEIRSFAPGEEATARRWLAEGLAS